jgi:hypothetical protein
MKPLTIIVLLFGGIGLEAEKAEIYVTCISRY